MKRVHKFDRKLANSRNHIRQMRANKLKNTRKTESCLRLA